MSACGRRIINCHDILLTLWHPVLCFERLVVGLCSRRSWGKTAPLLHSAPLLAHHLVSQHLPKLNYLAHYRHPTLTAGHPRHCAHGCQPHHDTGPLLHICTRSPLHHTHEPWTNPHSSPQRSTNSAPAPAPQPPFLSAFPMDT